MLPSLSIQQYLFLTFKGREALYGGAVGGGKSAGLLMAALRHVHRKGYSALLLRRTYAELSKSGGLIPLSHEWLGPTDAHWSGEQKTWRFPSGATIEFGHVQHEDDKTRYQGAAYQFVGFDELTHFTESIFLYVGFSRARRRLDIKDIPIQTFASANPGEIGHMWVKKRYITERASDVLFMPAKVSDNPGLDVEDYKLSLAYLPESLRKQLMEGDWDAFKGAAYDLSDEVHLVPPFPCPPEWERFEFMDHGLSNPAAWYLCAVDYDGNLVVLDSYYSQPNPSCLISEHCAEVLNRRGSWWPKWVDHEGKTQSQHPRTIADPSVTTRLGTMSKMGVPATIATEYSDQSDGQIVLIPGNNDPAAGMARIQELLRGDPERTFPAWHPRSGESGSPRLFIVGTRNVELVEQVKAAPVLDLESGKSGAGEKVDPDWEQAYGHAHAALRYGVMSRPHASEVPEEAPEDPRTHAMLEYEKRLRDKPRSKRYIDV